MASVLIVDDTMPMASALESVLRAHGYQTALASTGRQALASLRRATPDLVVLDGTLPDCSGTDLCRRIRGDPTTRRLPVVMLSQGDEEPARVAAFEAGADDCVAEPISMREFALRVRAVLRGTAVIPSAKVVRAEAGPIRLDLEAHRAFVGDEEIDLTQLEFRLLATLLTRAGRVQSREQLLEEVWDMSPELETRTVDQHVKRLRQKLGPAREMVETVRGVGYRVVDPLPST